MQGWTNKLLEINLKAQVIKTANIKNQVLESYIGEKGLGACLATRGFLQKSTYEASQMDKLILSATPDNIVAVSRKIKEGGLVVYPTDTVYGLGCDPFSPKVVERLFEVKSGKRKPLPILASDIKAVEKIAFLSGKARRVAIEFWPGPLTLVVPKKPTLPNIVTCNLNSVGVRVPNHDVTLQLIHLSNGRLVGTSANKTTEKPALTAQEAAKKLGREVDLILDGGPANLGVSSTVVDLTKEKPRNLREGPISFREIVQILS